MKNFLTRAFTSIFIFIIFAAIVISSFFDFVFELTISALCVFCVYESLNAQGYLKNKALSVLSLLYSFCIPLSLYFVNFFNKPSYFFVLVITFIYIILLNILAMKNFSAVKFNDCAAVIFSTVVISVFLSNIILLRKEFKHGLFYMILAICCYAWATDIFAYIVGVCIGKHKFSPNISPKKSLEGSIGGTLCCIIFSVLVTFIYSVIMDFSVNYVLVFVFSLLCSLVGQVGDFSFSYIKRSYGIKDFGKILPGHGGVLDRLDSLIFISPCLYMLLSVKEFIL